MRSCAPPLSPVLLLGLPLRIIPRALLDPALTGATRQAARRYPRVFERLAALGSVRFLIDPTDLPIRFDLRLDGGRPSLRVAPDRSFDATATVRGPLADLLALLEGRLDGDALFFARRLVVQGDTEAIVTLRNAVEGEEVDVLGLLLEAVAPFDRLLRAGLGPAARAYRLAESALAAFQYALEAPLQGRLDEQEAALDRLAARLEHIEKWVARRQPRIATDAP